MDESFYRQQHLDHLHDIIERQRRTLDAMAVRVQAMHEYINRAGRALDKAREFMGDQAFERVCGIPDCTEQLARLYELDIQTQLAITPLAPFPYRDDVPPDVTVVDGRPKKTTCVPLDNQPLVDVEDR